MTGILQGKRCVITGAGLGIGRAIAKHFAAEGARVVIATRGAADGEAALAEILSSGGDAQLINVDVGDRTQARQLIEDVVSDLGGLDILVHNAGYFPWAPLDQLSDDDLDKVMDINLKACFWLSQAALSALTSAPGGGRILITSSVSGNHANAPGLAAYSAAKAGVTGFVRNMALDLGPRQITVNAVEPGFIVTERNAVPEKAEMVSATAAAIPLQRAGEPNDVAYLMGFLASAQAAYITGQSIVVDGGLTLGTAQSIAET